jgi:hypothetical protein
MTRFLLTVLLPLLLPTALYLMWATTVGRAPAAGAPWLWLAILGAGLAAATIIVLNIGYGSHVQGTYVPPHISDGKVIPGEIVPNAPARP